MISCDKGKTRVEGRGNVILAEWGTLTFAVLRGFENETGETEEDEKFREQLKEKMRESLEHDFERAFSKKTDEELDKEDGEMLKANLLKLLLESFKS